MIAVYKREMQAYFFSPIGYAFSGFFLLVSGVFFIINNIFNMSPDLVPILQNMSYMFMLLVPVLTMRLFSEDRRNKTDQFLLTSPLPLISVILGKYFAALSVFLLTIMLTFLYPIIVAATGHLELLPLVSGYIGFFLMGAASISLGMLVSALTENQVIAAAATFGLLLVLFIIDTVTANIEIAWVVQILEWLSIYNRFSGFTLGTLALSGVAYYISFSGIFVFLTLRAVEKRRWSEG